MTNPHTHPVAEPVRPDPARPVVTLFVVADDGHGDPTLWARLGQHTFPVVSRSRLDQPSYWGDLVAAVMLGQGSDDEVSPPRSWCS
jgi:hypothetical protein